MNSLKPVALAGMMIALVSPSMAADAPVAGNGLRSDSIGDRSSTSLGLGVAYTPEYEGASDHRWRGLPILNVRRGRFFIGTTQGLGVDLSQSANVEFGPRVTYRGGRDEDDADRLRGLGDIDGGLELGAFVRVKLGDWFVRGDLRTGVGDTPDGLVADFGGGRSLRFGKSDSLILDASVGWADGEYNDTYFGVTRAQSIASGLPQYEAGAGIKRYGVGATWTHSFDGGWYSNLGVRVNRLTGDAADSPIVERESQVSGFAGIGYRF